MGVIEKVRDIDVRCPQVPALEKVIAVIPCLNECDHIGPLIADIIDIEDGIDLLVVVADGGSTDGTRKVVSDICDRDSRVRLIANPQRIQSAGVNLAARLFGKGRRWLARIDAHAEYPKHYISILIDEAQKANADSVVVSMTSRGTSRFQYATAAVQNSVLGAGGSAHRRQGKAEYVDHGHHAMFDLQRFVALGGYDETLSHNEDAEFDVRLGRAGGRIWLTRMVDIVYFPMSKPRELFRQYFNYGRGRATTLLRHQGRPKLRQMAPACVAPALVAVALVPWTPLAMVPALLWATTCLVFGGALGIRKGSLCALSAGFAAMVIHLGWSAGFWLEFIQYSKHSMSRSVTARVSHP